MPRPLRRDLDQGLVNKHRDRVQVRRVRLKPEALRLKRNRPAAGERVQDRRRIPAGRLQDLLVRFPQQLLVVDVLPDDQPGDDAVQPFALRLLRFLGRELFRVRRRVINKLREQHRPARGQRSPRPPQMQSRRMPVPDRLLPRRLPVDVLQWQRDLDQLRLVPEITAHTGSTPRSHSFSQFPIMPVAAKSPKSTSRNGSTI